MWQFVENINGVLFFTKEQMTRNVRADESEVATLIAQWDAEDAAQAEQNEEQ